ncbi:MAG: hypothetical protein AB1898_08200 [Acidobacteriota bacterium]
MPLQPCGFKKQVRGFLECRLDPAQLRQMKRHLDRCESCRTEVETWQWIQRRCIGHVEMTPESSAAEESSGAAWLHDMRPGVAFSKPNPQFRVQQRLKQAFGLLLLLMAVGLGRYLVTAPDLVSQVARDYRQIREGRIALAFSQESASMLERFFSERGIPFNTRVADLQPLKYRLVGGSVHRVVNRKSALCLYQGETGIFLLCEMFVGKAKELPDCDQVREEGTKQFFIYRDGTLNLIFWQDGEILCGLASDTSLEQLLQVAWHEAGEV